MTPLLVILNKVSGTRYHEPSALDARRHIAAFFHRIWEPDQGTRPEGGAGPVRRRAVLAGHLSAGRRSATALSRPAPITRPADR